MIDIWAQSEGFIVQSVSGKLYSIGWNEHGNLGLGDKNNRFELTEMPLNFIPSRIWTNGAYIIAENKI